MEIKRNVKIVKEEKMNPARGSKEAPIVIDSLLRALCEKGEEITLKANFDV